MIKKSNIINSRIRSVTLQVSLEILSKVIVIVKKSASSKLKPPRPVILGDPIVKNVYGNIITSSVKHQKHVAARHFPGAKIADMNHYKKPTQEKSPAEIIIHVGTNDLSSDNEPKDIANDIIQLAKSVKTDANKVAVSSILPRKDKFNSKIRRRKLTHIYKINVLQITSL